MCGFVFFSRKKPSGCISILRYWTQGVYDRSVLSKAILVRGGSVKALDVFIKSFEDGLLDSSGLRPLQIIIISKEIRLPWGIYRRPPGMVLCSVARALIAQPSTPSGSGVLSFDSLVGREESVGHMSDSSWCYSGNWCFTLQFACNNFIYLSPGVSK